MFFFTKTILSRRLSLKTEENANKTQGNVSKNKFSDHKRNFRAPRARKNWILKGFYGDFWSLFQCMGIYSIFEILNNFWQKMGIYSTIYTHAPLYWELANKKLHGSSS